MIKKKKTEKGELCNLSSLRFRDLKNLKFIYNDFLHVILEFLYIVVMIKVLQNFLILKVIFSELKKKPSYASLEIKKIINLLEAIEEPEC